MAFDRGTYNKFLEHQRQESARAAKPGYVAAHQAALSAEQLTQQPEWDVFLQMLQAALDEKIKERDSFLREIASESTITIEQMWSWKAKYLQANAMAFMLEHVINLPKRIIEDGQNARTLLEELEAHEAAE